MTPPVHSATAAPRAAGHPAHGASARRHMVVRRRALLVLIAAAFLAAVVVSLNTPLARKTVQHFDLPLAHADIIRQQAAEKHLDPALIAAVIYAESRFDPRPSPAGAQGLMQILPDTAELLARRSGATSFTISDLATPQVNITYGSYYLRYLLDEYRGNTMLALAAYNAGETNLDRWLAQTQAHGQRLTVADVPFAETRAYVQNVLQLQREYRDTYGPQLGHG